MVIASFDSPEFWIGLLQIIGIDILLSGDNAVVIALACRSLPANQRRRGIILGAGAAIVLRVIFAAFIVHLLAVPYLKIVGGLLLFWIAIKLLQPEEESHDADGVDPARNLYQAIRTIVVADAVMSLDNVVAIAAAAKGDVALLALGLLISIPLIVYGSTLILHLLDRYPVIIAVGGALLGYIAGETIATDPVLIDWVNENAAWLHYGAPIGGAVIVVVVGTAIARLRRRKLRRIKAARAELASRDSR